MKTLMLFLMLSSGLAAEEALRAAAGQLARGEVREAVQTLEATLAADASASQDVYLMLVDCHMRLDDSKAAVETLDRGLRAHPESVTLLKTAARLLLHDRKWSARANDPLERALKLAPDDVELHYYMSQWACLHNQEELCLEEAEKTLAMAPGNAAAGLQLNTLIGVAASKLGQPEKAEEAFRKALAYNRKSGLSDPAAAYRYVDFLNREARGGEALELAAEIVESAPSFGPAHLERAKALQREGKPEEAIQLGEKTLGLQGMQRENLRAAHMLLARCYFLLGDEEAAAKHQEWIEKNPH